MLVLSGYLYNNDYVQSGNSQEKTMCHQDEIEQAQKNLNRYAATAKFWDTEAGKKTILLARKHDLKSQTDNHALAKRYAEIRAMEREGHGR